MSVNEFRELREHIESLNNEMAALIRKKSTIEFPKRLEESDELLIELRNMVANEVQRRSVSRLTYELEYLATKIDGLICKQEAGKRGDGNTAFKCNWNDKYYKAPCSLEAYHFNVAQGRAWCNVPLNKCRNFTEATSKDYPCYESIALKEMFFGAGWDYISGKKRPRRIRSAREGKIALLTTRPPGADEVERLVIGCLFINSLIDNPGEETKIIGDKTKYSRS